MRNLKKLVIAAAIACQFTGAALAAEPDTVMYEVRFNSAGSPGDYQRTTLATTVGQPVASEIRSRIGGTSCTFKSQLGTSTISMQQGDGVAFTLVPVATTDGRVLTIVSSSLESSSLQGMETVGDCVVSKGLTQQWIKNDVVALPIGSETTLDIGSGHKMRIKLLSVARIHE